MIHNVIISFLRRRRKLLFEFIFKHKNINRVLRFIPITEKSFKEYLKKYRITPLRKSTIVVSLD